MMSFRKRFASFTPSGRIRRRITGGLNRQHTAVRSSHPREAEPIIRGVLRTPGQPLDQATRDFMEPRFGQDGNTVSVNNPGRSIARSSIAVSRPKDPTEQEADRIAEQIIPPDTERTRNSAPVFGERYDFSRVRIHTDSHAAALSQALHAEAFTFGSDIYFNQGRYSPAETTGKQLIAHELAHVSQQAQAGLPSIQRRLLLTGTNTDIADFIAMCERASGLVLRRNPLTNEVTAIGSSATPATSQSFATHLTQIINDPRQNAEINVGQNQRNVDIGAFPVPRDLTGGGVQNVDMDDIDAMEAGAPGIGVADLLHEIVENYEAHAFVPVAGVDLFPAAHEAGLQAEAEVATDIVGSGRRVAQADELIGTNISRIAEDYDTYYVLSTLTANPATGSFIRSNASFAPKVAVTTQTADRFVTNSNTFPATGAAAVAAVVAALNANPLATVRIEGFTDNRGPAFFNLNLSEDRANSAAAQLTAAGIDGGRIHIVARGAAGFIAPNGTEADRARNRRVVFTVTRP